MFVVPNELINFLIILAGVAYRTGRPWMQKYKAYAKACEEAEDNGQPMPDPRQFGFKKAGPKFSKRFLLSGGISFITILAVSTILGALQTNPALSGVGLFMWAIGQTEMINREIL
jgi:hypothetical protein